VCLPCHTLLTLMLVVWGISPHCWKFDPYITRMISTQNPTPQLVHQQVFASCSDLHQTITMIMTSSPTMLNFSNQGSMHFLSPAIQKLKAKSTSPSSSRKPLKVVYVSPYDAESGLWYSKSLNSSTREYNVTLKAISYMKQEHPKS
jgi:hypothetical protein